MSRKRPVSRILGMHKTKIYNVWCSMRQRCNNPKSRMFKHYGGRGIKVCSRWDDFTAFLSDMGLPPEGCSLDRIDNDKGYEPGNCRWATRSEQSRNRSDNHLITINGETLPLVDWAVRCGVKPTTARNRILLGWPDHLAVTTPPVLDKKGVPRGTRVAAWAQTAEYAGYNRSAEDIATDRARKTHCIRGHALSGDNLITKGNKRNCRECARLWMRNKRAQKRSDPTLIQADTARAA